MVHATLSSFVHYQGFLIQFYKIKTKMVAKGVFSNLFTFWIKIFWAKVDNLYKLKLWKGRLILLPHISCYLEPISTFRSLHLDTSQCYGIFQNQMWRGILQYVLVVTQMRMQYEYSNSIEINSYYPGYYAHHPPLKLNKLIPYRMSKIYVSCSLFRLYFTRL